MSDTNERSVASSGSHGDAVRSAALALYEAGRWVSVDVPREKVDAMWATLRDALGLRPGHATTRGVDGGGTKPALTDEEREAIAWFSIYSDTPGEERHAVVLAKLLQRTN